MDPQHKFTLIHQHHESKSEKEICCVSKTKEYNKYILWFITL